MNLSRRFRLLLTSFIFFLPVFGLTQTVRNLSIADGLPGNSIKCIFKDSKGLLWIATETGLCVYNGQTIRVIGEDQGLKYNLIWKITEDDQQNIWLSVYGNGVAKYDGKKFIYYSKKNGLINDNVRTLFYSKETKCMVFGTENGLSLYNGRTFQNFLIKNRDKSIKFQVNVISKFQNKILIASAYAPIYELSVNSKQLNKSKLIPFADPKTVNYAGFINNNHYYSINLLNQFSSFDLKLGIKKSYATIYHIWDFAKGTDESIYLATWAGNSPDGALMAFKNGQLTNLSSILDLPTNQLWCLYFDRPSNQLWVGTIDRGIFVIDLSGKTKYLRAIDFQRKKLEINCVFIDKQDKMWLGGNDFIIQKSKKNTSIWGNTELLTKIRNYLKKLAPKSRLKLDKQLYPATNFICHSIREDKFGRIWAITNYGVVAFNEHNEVCQFLRLQETSGMVELANQDTLFVAQNYSECYLIPLARPDQYITLTYKGIKPHLNVLRLFQRFNQLWVASFTQGLFLWDKGHLVSMKQANGIYDNNISEVYCAPNGNIYTGTMSGKIYVCNWIHGQFKRRLILRPEKEIIGNSIFFIRSYRDFLLVGTNKGINILKHHRLIKFINAAEFLENTLYKDAFIANKTGQLHIASYSGMMTLDLTKWLKKEHVNSPIHLDSFKVNGKEKRFLPLIHLPYNQQNIQIHFSSTNLYNAAKNRYRYKISGISDNWSPYSEQHTIQLFALNPGTYHIVIQGKNIGTNESIKPLSMWIQIASPFWKTWWFNAGFWLIIGSILRVIISRRIKRIRNTADLERRIAETKLEALQSQMNPHFVFNAMNSIQNFVIDNHTDDALWYIGEFSKMMRQTLDFSSRQYIRLEEEIDYLKRYIELENLRRNVKVNIQFNIDPSIDLFETSLPPMIIQPLVENVFVHAFNEFNSQPILSIHFKNHNGQLQCQISDNGIGMDQFKISEIHSKGMRLARERMSLNNKYNNTPISIDSTEKGTQITLNF